MPKRVVDGEGVWRSQKLKMVHPYKFRPEYANLIPLALANGVFEADPALIWVTVYGYNRPDWKESDVADLLTEYERVGLLFRWNEPDGKVWGYWPGIDKPGRLPSKVRQGKNEKIGPVPPTESNGIHRNPVVTNDDGNGLHLLAGLGSGSGSGSGSGAVEPEPLSHIETALIVCQESHLSGNHIVQSVERQLLTFSKGNPLKVAAEIMIKAIARYKELGGTKIYFWLSEGSWSREESAWGIVGMAKPQVQQVSASELTRKLLENG